MLYAKKKRKENIAEYILYLYQVEDLIRAFQFDLDLINSNLVSQYQTDEATSAEIADWYNNLVMMMEKEQIKEKGHLQFLTNQVADLNDLHLQLMQQPQSAYQINFQSITPILAELKKKNPTARNDVQLAIDTLYGYLLLKIKKQEINPATTQAVEQLSQWLSLLSANYKDFESGKLDI